MVGQIWTVGSTFLSPIPQHEKYQNTYFMKINWLSVSDLTSEEFGSITSALTSRKPGNTENQWLFLDSLENWSHKENLHFEIWRDRCSKTDVATKSGAGAINWKEKLNSNFDELLEMECELLREWELLWTAGFSGGFSRNPKSFSQWGSKEDPFMTLAKAEDE